MIYIGKIKRKVIAIILILSMVVGLAATDNLFIFDSIKEASGAESNATVSVTYVDITGEETPYVDASCPASSVTSRAMLNGRQVKKYYMGKLGDKYDDYYFPGSNKKPTVRAAEVTVYTEYEKKDSPVFYVNGTYGAMSADYNADTARATAYPAKWMSGVINSMYKFEDYKYYKNLKYVIQYGISLENCKNISEEEDAITPGSARVDMGGRIQGKDKQDALTGTNLYPTNSDWGKYNIELTGRYQGINYNSPKNGLLWRNGTGHEDDREIVAYNDFTMRDINVILNNQKYKWVLLENNGHKITVDNVNFYDTNQNLIQDFKIYRCNNLKNNGLKVRLIDAEGKELKVLGKDRVSIDCSKSDAMYFTIKDTDYENYTLKNVNITDKVTEGKPIEMQSTYKEGETDDVIDIIATGTNNYVNCDITYKDAQGVTEPKVLEQNVIESGGIYYAKIPSEIEGRQVSKVKSYDGKVGFPNEEWKAVGTVNSSGSITIDVYYEDCPTYYVGKAVFCNDTNDGLSPATAFATFEKVRSVIKEKYTAKDKVRIVVVNSRLTKSESIFLSKGYDDGVTYSADTRGALLEVYGDYDVNTDNNYNGLIAGTDTQEVPELHITSKWNNINYNSGFYYESDTGKTQKPSGHVAQYNKVIIDNIRMSGQHMVWYCQGNDLEIGEGLMTNEFNSVQATPGHYVSISNGIRGSYPNFSIMGASLGEKIKGATGTGYCKPRGKGTYAPTITINSGKIGRVMGGGRIGRTGTEDQLFNPTINLGGNADISLVLGCQSESYFYGTPTINVSGECFVWYLSGGTLGYKRDTITEEERVKFKFLNETHTETDGKPTTINMYGGHVKRLCGGSVARSTTSVADYGDIEINILHNPEGTEGTKCSWIEYLIGGSAAGVMLGNVTINIEDPHVEIDTIFGGGRGKSDYITYNDANTNYNDYWDGIINSGNAGYVPFDKEGASSDKSTIVYDEIKNNIIGGHATVNITAGYIAGNVYGGGHGFNYGEAGRYSVAQIWDGTEVNISGSAHVHGNVYGGGDGNVVSDLIAQVYPETKVSIKPDAVVIDGNVYGGGNNAYTKGKCTVEIDGATVKGKVYGAGANAGVAEDVSLSIVNSTVESDIYGGGENGNVPGNIKLNISNSNITGNVIGGGEYGAVGGTIDVTVENGSTVVGDIVGGGIKGDVNGPVTVVLKDSKVEHAPDGSGGEVFGGSIFSTVANGTHVTVSNSAVDNRVYGGGKYGDILSGGTVVDFINGSQSSNVVGGGQMANVNGGTTVNITDSTVTKHVIGGGYEGNVNGDTYVNITQTATGKTQISGEIVGGGYQGNVDGDTHLNLNAASPDNKLTVDAVIYDGGFGDKAVTLGDSYVNISNTVMGKDEQGKRYPFFLGGGSGSVEGNVNVTKDESEIIFDFSTKNPNRQAEEFKGWVLTANGEGPDGTVQSYAEHIYGETKWGTQQQGMAENQAFRDEFNKTDTGSKLNAPGEYVFSLEWDLRYFTIKYNANVPDGMELSDTSEEMLNTSAFVTQNRKLRKNIWSLKNDTKYFAGWNTEPNGSGQHYADETFINIDEETLKSLATDYLEDTQENSGKSAGTINLYAVWQDVPTRVKAYSTYTQNGKEAIITSEIFDKLQETDTKKYEYQYQWYVKDKDGNRTAIENEKGENLVIPKADLAVTENRYYVVVTMTETHTDGATPKTWELISNEAWVTVNTMKIYYYDELTTNGSLQVSDDISEETAKHIIYIDESQDFYAVISPENLCKSPVHDKQLFKGWYIDKACTIPYDESTGNILGDTTLYAGWREISTVRHDAGDEILKQSDVTVDGAGDSRVCEFELIGVQIRTYETATVKQGLRFLTRIGNSLKADVEALNPKNVPLRPTKTEKGKGYGTIITLTSRAGFSIDGDMQKEVDAKGLSTGNYVVPAHISFFDCDEYEYYSSVIQGMPEQFYTVPVVGRSYITYYDVNGNENTYYYTETKEYSEVTKTGAFAKGYAISYGYTAKYVLQSGFYDDDAPAKQFVIGVYNKAFPDDPIETTTPDSNNEPVADEGSK